MKTGKKIIVLVVLFFVFFPVFVQAAPDWWPIVPCGTSVNPAECTKCDLFRLFKNIIDFVLVGLMPPVAAILFVWAGFLVLMGGANPGNISQGRTIFWNAFMGVLIISSSWLITNTIIKSLAEESITNPNVPWYQFECRETVGGGEKKYACQNNSCVEDINGTYTEATCNNECQTAPGNVSITTASLPDATQNQSYSQTLIANGGTTPYTWSISSGSLPAGLTGNPSTGAISGTPTTAGTSTFTVKVTDNSTPQKSATKQFSIIVSQTTGDACSTPPTLAQSHSNAAYPRKRSPELEQLLSCMAGKLGQTMPSEAGSNSFYGSLYTYDQSSVLCNYTRADKHCDSSCSHAANSCHYGGKTGTEGSLAADFGNETKGDIIIQAALNCGAKSARCENAAGVTVSCTSSGATHIHISSPSCDAN